MVGTQPIRWTVRGRLYAYGYSRPQTVGVRVTRYFTRSGPHAYLAAEEVLGVTPFIHDCRVQVSGSSFMVYFTRHRILPPNRAVLSVHDSTPWHGQMLVVRLDEAGTEHVNLKRGDIKRINTIIPRCEREILSRRILPAYIWPGSSTRSHDARAYRVRYCSGPLYVYLYFNKADCTDGHARLAQG